MNEEWSKQTNDGDLSVAGTNTPTTTDTGHAPLQDRTLRDEDIGIQEGPGHGQGFEGKKKKQSPAGYTRNRDVEETLT